MTIEKYRLLLAMLALAGLAGCAQKESPQQLQQQTAQATAEAKSDVKAVAEGIREGLNRDKLVDINRAGKDQLTSLDGVTNAEADRIVLGRPYNDTGDLVTRHILPKSEYDRIADHITVNR